MSFKIQPLNQVQLQKLSKIPDTVSAVKKIQPLQHIQPIKQEPQSRAGNIMDYNDPYAINSMADVITRTKLDNNPTGLVSTAGIAVDTVGDVLKIAGAASSLLNPVAGLALVKTGKTLSKIGNVIKYAPLVLDKDYNEMMKRYFITPAAQGDWQAVGYNALQYFGESADLTAQPLKAFIPLAGGSPAKGIKNLQDTWQGMLGNNTGAPRHNYDYDTGNTVADIALEVVSDPLDITEFVLSAPITVIKTRKQLKNVSNVLKEFRSLRKTAKENAANLTKDWASKRADEIYEPGGAIYNKAMTGDSAVAPSVDWSDISQGDERFYVSYNPYDSSASNHVSKQGTAAFQEMRQHAVEDVIAKKSKDPSKAKLWFKQRQFYEMELRRIKASNLSTLSKARQIVKLTEEHKQIVKKLGLWGLGEAAGDLVRGLPLLEANKALTTLEKNIAEGDAAYINVDKKRGDVIYYSNLASKFKDNPTLYKYFTKKSGVANAELSKALRKTPEIIAGVNVRAINNINLMPKLGKASFIARMSISRAAGIPDIITRKILGMAIMTAGPFPALTIAGFKGIKKAWNFAKRLYIKYAIKHIDETRLLNLWRPYRNADGTLNLNRVTRLADNTDSYLYRSKIQMQDIVKIDEVARNDEIMHKLSLELRDTLSNFQDSIIKVCLTEPNDASLLELYNIFQKMMPDAAIDQTLSLQDKIKAYLKILEDLTDYTQTNTAAVAFREFYPEFRKRLLQIIEDVNNHINNADDSFAKYGKAYPDAASDAIEKATKEIDKYHTQHKVKVYSEKVNPKTGKPVKVPVSVRKLNRTDAVKARLNIASEITEEQLKLLKEDWDSLSQDFIEMLSQINPGFREEFSAHLNKEQYVRELLKDLWEAYFPEEATTKNTPPAWINAVSEFLEKGITLPQPGTVSVSAIADYEKTIQMLDIAIDELSKFSAAYNETLWQTSSKKANFINKFREDPGVVKLIDSAGNTVSSTTFNKRVDEFENACKILNVSPKNILESDTILHTLKNSERISEIIYNNSLKIVEDFVTDASNTYIDPRHFTDTAIRNIDSSYYKRVAKEKALYLKELESNQTDFGNYSLRDILASKQSWKNVILRNVYYTPPGDTVLESNRVLSGVFEDTSIKMNKLAMSDRLNIAYTNNFTNIAEGKAYQIQNSISYTQDKILSNKKLKRLFDPVENPGIHGALQELATVSYTSLKDGKNPLAHFIKTEAEFTSLQTAAQHILNNMDSFRRRVWFRNRVYSDKALLVAGAKNIKEEQLIQRTFVDALDSLWNVTGRQFYENKAEYTDAILKQIRTFTKTAPVKKAYNMDDIAANNKRWFRHILSNKYNLTEEAAHNAKYDVCRLDAYLTKNSDIIPYPSNEIHIILDTEYTITGAGEAINPSTKTLEVAYKVRSRDFTKGLQANSHAHKLTLSDIDLDNVSNQTYAFFKKHHADEVAKAGGDVKAAFTKYYTSNTLDHDAVYTHLFKKLYEISNQPGKTLRLIAHNGLDADFKLLQQEFEAVKAALIYDVTTNPEGIFVTIEQADTWFATLQKNSKDSYAEMLIADGVPTMTQEQAGIIKQHIYDMAELSRNAPHIGQALDSTLVDDLKSIKNVLTDFAAFEGRQTKNYAEASIDLDDLLKDFKARQDLLNKPATSSYLKTRVEELKEFAISPLSISRHYASKKSDLIRLVNSMELSQHDRVRYLNAIETVCDESIVSAYTSSSKIPPKSWFEQLQATQTLLEKLPNLNTTDVLYNNDVVKYVEKVQEVRDAAQALDRFASVKPKDFVTAAKRPSDSNLVKGAVQTKTGAMDYSNYDFLDDIGDMNKTITEALEAGKHYKYSNLYTSGNLIKDSNIFVKDGGETIKITNLNQLNYLELGRSEVGIKTIFDADLDNYFEIHSKATVDNDYWRTHLNVMKDIKDRAAKIKYPEHLSQNKEALLKTFGNLVEFFKSRVQDSQILHTQLDACYTIMKPASSISECFIQVQKMYATARELATTQELDGLLASTGVRNLLDYQDSRLYTNRVIENKYCKDILNYQKDTIVTCHSALERLDKVTAAQEAHNMIGYHGVVKRFKANVNNTIMYEASQFNRQLGNPSDTTLLTKTKQSCSKIPETQRNNRFAFLNAPKTVDEEKYIDSLTRDLVYNPLHTVAVDKKFFTALERCAELSKHSNIKTYVDDDFVYFYLSKETLQDYTYNPKKGVYYYKNKTVERTLYNNAMPDDPDNVLQQVNKIQTNTAHLYDMDPKDYSDSYGRTLSKDELTIAYNTLPTKVQQAIGLSEDLLDDRMLNGRVLYNNVFIDEAFCPGLLPDIQDPVVNYVALARNATEELNVRTQYAHMFFDSSDKLLLNDPKNSILSSHSLEDISELCGAMEVDGQYKIVALLPVKQGASLKVMSIPTDNPSFVKKLLDENKIPLKVMTDREYNQIKNIVEKPFNNPMIRAWREVVTFLKCGWLFTQVGFFVRNMLDTTLKTLLEVGVKDTVKYSKDALIWQMEYNKAIKAMTQLSCSRGIINDDVAFTLFSDPALLNKYRIGIDYDTFQFLKRFKDSDASAAIVKAQEDYKRYGKAYKESKFYKQKSIVEKNTNILKRAQEYLEQSGTLSESFINDIKNTIDETVAHVSKMDESDKNLKFMQELKTTVEDVYQILTSTDEQAKLPAIKDTLKKLSDIYNSVDEGTLADYLKSTRKLPKGEGLVANAKQIWNNGWGMYNRFLSIPSSINSFTEETNRLTMFLKYSDEGLITEQEIFNRIKKVHFDYSHKTQATSLTELVIPFYNYTKSNTAFWMEMFEERPDLVRLLTNIMAPVQNFDGYSAEELNQNRSLLNAIVNGYVMIDQESGLMLKANPSFLDAFALFTNPVQAMQQRLIPIIPDSINALRDWENFNVKDLLDNIPWVGSIAQRVDAIKRNQQRLDKQFESNQTPLIRQKLVRAAASVSSTFAVPARYRSAKYTSDQYYKHWRNYRSPVRSIYTKTGISKLQIMMEPVSPDNIKYKLGVMQSFVNRQ